MALTSGRAVDRCARCDDAVWSPLSGGTVVLPAGDRAAVAPTSAKSAVRADVAESAPVPSLVATCGGRDETVRTARPSLAARGVVRGVA